MLLSVATSRNPETTPMMIFIMQHMYSATKE